MTRNENQKYSGISSIAKSLEKFANALDTPNVVYNGELKNTKDIPGFEGTLDALDVLTDIKTITDEYASNKELHEQKLHTDEGPQNDDHVHSDYLTDLVKEMTKEQYVRFFLDMDFGFALSDTAAFNNHIYELDYEEVLDCIKSARNILDEPTSENPDPAGYGNKDPYTYDNNLREFHCGVVNDSDFNIRKTAYSYEAALDSETQYTSKKDCILDYVTNEFGILGARYTDIIKFAYYLGSPNALKYTSADRGYYSCAFNTRFGGHLIQGGKDFLVKGINNEGKERYFALSSVDNFTGFWKYIK